MPPSTSCCSPRAALTRLWAVLPSVSTPPGPDEPSQPGRPLHTSPERRRRGSVRRRPAARRGATTTDHPEPPNHHPQVRTSPLNLFPNFPLAAGAEPRRKTAARPCSVLSRPPRTSSEKKQKSRGLDARFPFLFLLFSKTANFENAHKFVEKSEKCKSKCSGILAMKSTNLLHANL